MEVIVFQMNELRYNDFLFYQEFFHNSQEGKSMISTNYAYNSATTAEYKTQKVSGKKTYEQQTKRECKNVVKEKSHPE